MRPEESASALRRPPQHTLQVRLSTLPAQGYLPLIEQKIGALDQAAPLAGWDLPEAFITLRRLLEARMGKAGKREYVQVLRLLETFRLEEVEGCGRRRPAARRNRL